VGLRGRPSPTVSWPWRAAVVVFHLVGRALGFRLRLEGAEHLPRMADGRVAGGWIAAALPHRTWIDPFVLVELLPAEPRLVWLGDGRAIYRSWWRRLVMGRLLSVVPIWPGGGRPAVEAHLQAVEAVIEAGSVFVVFPEVGPPVPVEQARQLAAGLGYFALRTGAPIVPLIIGGGDELFLRRRLILRVLPAFDARELLGLAAGEPLPEPWTRAEREAAHRIVRELEARTTDAVAEAHRAVEPAAGRPKRWRWLTSLFE
jgi:1-acyl-sn-glycerol-3-phosphate acyltransferase